MYTGFQTWAVPMTDNRYIQVFDREAAETGAYPYTAQRMLSSRFATQRSVDAVLQTKMFAGRSVLDIGCGDGYFTCAFWNGGGMRRMVALDLAFHAVQAAQSKREAAQISFLQSNADQLPFPDSSFDLALLQSVLHHSPTPARLIREALRIAPEVLIHEPNGNNPILKVIEKTSPIHREHGEKSYAPRQIRRWIEQAGGEVATLQFAGFVPMYSPEWLARIVKKMEPSLEQFRWVSRWLSAVYVLTGKRKPGLLRR
jgi:ubiquinone/menaquinone biosynthesis C-methylase UbiE